MGHPADPNEFVEVCAMNWGSRTSYSGFCGEEARESKKIAQLSFARSSSHSQSVSVDCTGELWAPHLLHPCTVRAWFPSWTCSEPDSRWFTSRTSALAFTRKAVSEVYRGPCGMRCNCLFPNPRQPPISDFQAGREQVAHRIEEFVEGFRPMDGQVGAISVSQAGILGDELLATGGTFWQGVRENHPELCL